MQHLVRFGSSPSKLITVKRTDRRNVSFNYESAQCQSFLPDRWRCERSGYDAVGSDAIANFWTLVGKLVADAFRASGLTFPPKGVAFGSVHLHSALLASGDFVAIYPSQMLPFGPHLPSLKVLPVKLPIPPSPVGVMMLKARTHRPAIRLFIDGVHECAKPVAAQRR